VRPETRPLAAAFFPSSFSRVPAFPTHSSSSPFFRVQVAPVRLKRIFRVAPCFQGPCVVVSSPFCPTQVFYCSSPPFALLVTSPCVNPSIPFREVRLSAKTFLSLSTTPPLLQGQAPFSPAPPSGLAEVRFTCPLFCVLSEERRAAPTP